MNRILYLGLMIVSVILLCVTMSQAQVSTLVPGSTVTSYTVATLPTTPKRGDQAYVTDGNSTSDCTAGGGSTKVPCIYNGLAWVWMANGAALSGSDASKALDNLASVNINTSLLAQAGVDLGSTVKPFRDLFLFGAGTYGTNYFRFTGTPTGTRTLTVPNETGTVCTTGSVCSGYQASLGFTAENAANKENTTIDTSTTKYPTVNLLKLGLATKIANSAGTNVIPMTADSSGNLGSPKDGNSVLPVGTGSFTATAAEPAPSETPSVDTSVLGTNNLTAGDYRWKITFITAEGETTPSDASELGTTDPLTNGPPNLSLPISSSSLVTGRKLYRTVANGSVFKLVATINDNTTNFYDDNIADASLGAVAPTTNTTANVALKVTPTSLQLWQNTYPLTQCADGDFLGSSGGGVIGCIVPPVTNFGTGTTDLYAIWNAGVLANGNLKNGSGTVLPASAGSTSLGDNDNGFGALILAASGGGVVTRINPGSPVADIGIGLPSNTTTFAEGLLVNGSNTTTNMNTGTATTLYTCPTNLSCVITKIVVRSASTSLTTASWSYGWNSSSFNDVIANATHTELTGSTLYTILLPKAGAKIGAAADVLKVIMNTVQGATATTRMDVYGYTF